MGYRLNCPDEPVFMAVSKHMLTEFGMHYRLESCELSILWVMDLPVLSNQNVSVSYISDDL